MPAPNMARVVRRMAFTITRRRYAPDTTNASGLRVRGAATDTPIRAFVHDESGSTMTLAPEGQSVDNLIHGYSEGADNDVRVADEATRASADAVQYLGRWYEVTMVRPWASGPLGSATWREFLAKLVERDEAP